jgi:hypothetical protein
MAGTRQVTRALSDGIGLSQEEIVAVITGVAAAAAVLGVLRAFDTLRDAWPSPHVASIRHPS